MDYSKEKNGTYYHKDTPDAVVAVLEECRLNQTRIVLDYGDTTTKKSWGEIHDIKGRVGRSTGDRKIPILLHNSRSMGGCSILTHCILSIKESKGGRVLYSLD